MKHITIHQAYPERRGRFHVTEFARFVATAAWILAEEGELDGAERLYQMLLDAEIDTPIVRSVGRIIRSKRMSRAGMLEWLRKRLSPYASAIQAAPSHAEQSVA